MGNKLLFDDASMAAQIANGDEQAFTAVYNFYQEKLILLAYQLLKSESLSKDVYNEVFTNLWANRESIQHVGSLKAYLVTSIKNRSINLLKSIARSEKGKQQIRFSFPQKSFVTEKYLLDKEYAAFIQYEIEQLPPKAKEVFKLCREQGYSYEQASSHLGISRHAVKHHMMYCIKKLKLSAEKVLGISLLFTFCLFCLLN